jgi:SAM-dependent methyltransferase
MQIELPPRALRFMQEDDARFVREGALRVAMLRDLGFHETSSILDVGSAYGRLPIAILREIAFDGDYEGFDILPRHVAWCQEHITTRAPRVRFQHLDVANGRYNGGGALAATDLRFPYDAARFDFCTAISVFTHMYAPDIRHYLHEMRRTMRDGGTGLVTFFLHGPDRLAAVTSDSCHVPMRCRLDPDTLYHDEADPLHAICHSEQRVREWMRDAAFEVLAIRHGCWSGEPADDYQDRVVLRAA